MKAYTFSNGGGVEGFYLVNLSSTIQGVGNLINDFFNSVYIDREFNSIQLVGDRLLVWYTDLHTKEKESLYYDLITFNII